MFTGLIEALGKVEEIKEEKGNKLLRIESPWRLNSGESISIDGACLTVKECKENSFSVEVTPQTLRTTIIRYYKRGAIVNLERPLRADGRIGGHFVLGHIDECGRIRSIRKYPGYQTMEIEVSKMRYIVEKGSVAVNGISLTIAGIKQNSFLVNIIPYTLKNTNLAYKRVGDFLNIEFDYLVKIAYKRDAFPKTKDL